MINQLVLNSLKRIVNEYLQLDPNTFFALKKWAGKKMQIDITDIHKKLFILVDEQGLVFSLQTTNPDVVISGSLMNLIKAISKKNQRVQNVSVTGDTEFAHEFTKIFQNMEVDWEERLSFFTGDIISHQVGNVVRGAKNFIEHTVLTLQKNTSEYFQEEIHLYPSKEEMEDFFSDIAMLRHDVDRLEAKWQRLDKESDESI